MSKNNPPIRLLALDTSGPALQLAIYIDGETLSFVEQIARGHAEILFPRLQDFLSSHKLAYQQLSHLAVTTGPGSFTGLRIGIAAARGLALALDIPVIGVPNLLALSLSKKEPHDGVISLIVEAGRGQYYAQDFVAPGKQKNQATLIESHEAKTRLLQMGQDMPDTAKVNIGTMAMWAANANPLDFPPEPTYVRAADAKPQTRAKIARTAPVQNHIE